MNINIVSLTCQVLLPGPREDDDEGLRNYQTSLSPQRRGEGEFELSGPREDEEAQFMVTKQISVPVPERFMSQRWESFAVIHPFDKSKLITSNCQRWLDSFVRQNTFLRAIEDIKVKTHIVPVRFTMAEKMFYWNEVRNLGFKHWSATTSMGRDGGGRFGGRNDGFHQAKNDALVVNSGVIHARDLIICGNSNIINNERSCKIGSRARRSLSSNLAPVSGEIIIPEEEDLCQEVSFNSPGEYEDEQKVPEPELRSRERLLHLCSHFHTRAGVGKDDLLRMADGASGSTGEAKLMLHSKLMKFEDAAKVVEEKVKELDLYRRLIGFGFRADCEPKCDFYAADFSSDQEQHYPEDDLELWKSYAKEVREGSRPVRVDAHSKQKTYGLPSLHLAGDEAAPNAHPAHKPSLLSTAVVRQIKVFA